MIKRSSPILAQSRLKASQEIAKAADNVVGEDHPEASVVVLDNFKGSGPLGMSHGDQVSRVLTYQGLEQEKLRHVQTAPYTNATFSLLKSKELAPAELLTAFFEGTAVDFIQSTQTQIEQQADKGVKTINHSATLSSAKVASYLINQAIDYGEDGIERNLTSMGAFLCEALGLPKSADWENECKWTQGVHDLAADLFENSPRVKKARDSFDSQLASLKEDGVVYFAASGNDAKVLRSLKRMGVQVASSMIHGINCVPSAVVVGAVDDKGTKTTSDDEVAGFSVPHPSTDFLSPGVGIDIGMGALVKGTSFACPKVALRYEQLRQENPEKSVDQLIQDLAANSEGSVKGSSVPVVR